MDDTSAIRPDARQESFRQATSKVLDATHRLDLAMADFYQAVCERRGKIALVNRLSRVRDAQVAVADALCQWERPLYEAALAPAPPQNLQRSPL